MLLVKNARQQELARLVESGELDTLKNSLEKKADAAETREAIIDLQDETIASREAIESLRSAATQSTNGLMSAADKKKLDGIATGAQVNPTLPTVGTLFSESNTNPGHLAVFNDKFVNAGYCPIANAKSLFTPAVATQSANGLISAADKKKLDGIAAGAQANPGAATQAAAGLMSAADKTKLDGIAAGAQVNPSLSGYAQLSGATFTGNITISNTSPRIIIKNTSATQAGTAGNYYTTYLLQDKNGATLGYVQTLCNTSGNTVLQLFAQNNGSSTQAGITIDARKDNSHVFKLSANPTASSNDSIIATTSWTRARISAATGKGATTFSLGEDVTLMSMARAAPRAVGAIAPAMRNAALEAIKQYVSAAIFMGFEYVIQDNTYWFTYDLYDQQNIADATLLAMQNMSPVIFARSESGDLTRLVLSAKEALALHLFATVDHKEACMSQGLAMREKAQNAQNETELEALLEKWGLLEIYTEHLKASAESD